MAKETAVVCFFPSGRLLEVDLFRGSPSSFLFHHWPTNNSYLRFLIALLDSVNSIPIALNVLVDYEMKLLVESS